MRRGRVGHSRRHSRPGEANDAAQVSCSLCSRRGDLAAAGCGGDDVVRRRDDLGRRLEHRRAVRHAAAEEFRGRERHGRHGRHLRAPAAASSASAAARPTSRTRRARSRTRRARSARRTGRVRRAPGRERRADGRRQRRERLGDVPDRRGAEDDLGARLDGRRTGATSATASRTSRSKLFGAGNGLRDVRLLHRRDQRRGGREPHRLLAQRGRQRHRAGRLRRRRAGSATSASRTSRRTRTR